MDYQLSEEQQMLVDMVRRFVREEICPLEDKLDPDAGEIHPDDSERLKAMTRKMAIIT